MWRIGFRHPNEGAGLALQFLDEGLRTPWILPRNEVGNVFQIRQSFRRKDNLLHRFLLSLAFF